MGGPTLRSNASPFRTREKNELLAEFLFRDPVQRVEPREIWVRQLIGPLVEFPGHVVGRQRAAMGVEQEDQLHQDSRGVGLLGSKVEHRHDVAGVGPGRTEGVRIMLQRKSVPSISKAAILSLGSPFLNAHGYSSTWICSWNQYTSFSFPAPFCWSTILPQMPVLRPRR